MKKFSAFILFLAISLTLHAQESALDYYYPIGMPITLNVYAMGHMEGNIGIERINTTMINYGCQTQISTIGNPAWSRYIDMYEVDAVVAANSSLVVNKAKTNGNSVRKWNNWTLLKVPAAGRTEKWTNEGKDSWGSYYCYNFEAKKVTIDFYGRTINAIRVIQWEDWGERIVCATTFWVKNWGKVLSLDENFEPVRINTGLFDVSIAENAVVAEAKKRGDEIYKELITPKVYNSRPAKFKPCTTPSDLLDFCSRFSTAIRNREDLKPFIGGQLLDYYNDTLEFGDNSSECFSIYMKDPYFSGLDSLAVALDNIKTTCSFEEYGRDGEHKVYEFPGYAQPLYKIEGASPYQEAVSLGEIVTYTKKDVESRKKYLIKPWNIFYIESWNDDWMQVLTLDLLPLGYIKPSESIFSFNNRYVFGIEKTTDGYKLTMVISNNISEDEFHKEVKVRETEKAYFKKRHDKDYRMIHDLSQQADQSISEVMESELIPAFESYCKSNNVLNNHSYSYGISVLAKSADSIDVSNTGIIAIKGDNLKKVVSTCFKDGTLNEQYAVLSKFNYAVPIFCKYSQFGNYSTEVFSATMKLQKAEWTPDKNSMAVYEKHKYALDAAIQSCLQNSPKAKKLSFTLVKVRVNNSDAYFFAEAVKMPKKQETQYKIGERVL
jgi:hypothetical protein